MSNDKKFTLEDAKNFDISKLDTMSSEELLEAVEGLSGLAESMGLMGDDRPKVISFDKIKTGFFSNLLENLEHAIGETDERLNQIINDNKIKYGIDVTKFMQPMIDHKLPESLNYTELTITLLACKNLSDFLNDDGVINSMKYVASQSISAEDSRKIHNAMVQCLNFVHEMRLNAMTAFRNHKQY